MEQANLDDAINAIIKAMGQMDSNELGITIQEAVQCILCTLYGASSNVKHSIQPVNGLSDLIRALNDPYVRKGLGLVIELLRSMGKCLDAAEKVKSLGDGASCNVELPCYIIAHGGGKINLTLTGDEKEKGAEH